MRIPWAALLAPVAMLLVVVEAPASTNCMANCQEVRGRLESHVVGDVTVGRMAGSIEGDYVFTLGPSFEAGIPDLAIWFTTGTSVVQTEVGSLFLAEAAALDTDEQVLSNLGAVATITGGTGKWQAASGHLIFSGFFHTGSESAEITYQGEVCKCSALLSREEKSWGMVKGAYR